MKTSLIKLCIFVLINEVAFANDFWTKWHLLLPGLRMKSAVIVSKFK